LGGLPLAGLSAFNEALQEENPIHAALRYTHDRLRQAEVPHRISYQLIQGPST